MLDIVENLGKRQLSVTSFASRYSVTTRYIQKLFEGEGTTFTEYVLERRLLERQAFPHLALDRSPFPQGVKPQFLHPRVRQMFKIPREQEENAVNGADADMRGVARRLLRNGPARDQRIG